MLVAQQFAAAAAVMLVHSFSPTDRWFDDFAAFAKLFGVRAQLDHVSRVGVIDGRPLFIGWSKGDQRFRGRV
jgi:hypothetical protein